MGPYRDPSVKSDKSGTPIILRLPAILSKINLRCDLFRSMWSDRCVTPPSGRECCVHGVGYCFHFQKIVKGSVHALVRFPRWGPLFLFGRLRDIVRLLGWWIVISSRLTGATVLIGFFRHTQTRLDPSRKLRSDALTSGTSFALRRGHRCHLPTSVGILSIGGFFTISMSKRIKGWSPP